MSKIALQDIWKKFKTTEALSGIDFETRDGELFCLLGPSGAGKTTTLRIIAGLEEPDRGDVLLDGKSIVKSMPSERDVTLAFESYALYPQFSVYDNLAFPLKAPVRKNEFSNTAIQARVNEIASLLGIQDLLQRFPRELSGGQRQRVGLGRALVRKPKVYLLDEPIAHLDAKLRHRMRGELKKIQTELGITTIYSTPDQLEAIAIADTVAVMNKGKIEQVAPPGEVYKNPCNVFVAQLVGDPPMNILESTLESGSIVVDCDVNFKIPIPTDAPASLLDQPNGKVLVGIRPKDITYFSSDSEPMHTHGRTKEAEILGQTTIVIVGVGCLDLKVKMATVDAPSRDALVGLKVDTTKLHFFSAATQKRLT
jgi:multiple sugar transport system ATP-binding protein